MIRLETLEKQIAVLQADIESLEAEHLKIRRV
jgi:hypothetical protein